ncbi:pyridoxal phosphate-dependent aminotransferase [Asaia krungthepensis]|uniref:Histidinol-phosphate aminotransferase n=1 Tax=Asaia krungthepensis NRIC 0535 TaxID=1307925 RepID=A0ABQ0Q620_9PROT|nr:histidinol-phosphate transaminase [Asaia krungthepensis]GBQ93061.1 histidinol phosphate aminotransferase [Asaia krungthepensis NRIC 0535]
MSRFWNPLVASLHPYIPGEQPQFLDILKLNTNELPYGPSPAALTAMREGCEDSLRLYPDPTAKTLREVIAQTYDTSIDRVFVGNGSDEVLGHAFRALISPESPMLFADVSYGFYPVYCGLFDQPYQEIPLNARFEIDVEDYAIPCGGIAIANPNANTGHAIPLEAISRLASMQPDRTIIIDEAYVDFGAQSAIRLTEEHDNLLVVQTLSKSRALAGLRVGYAIGHPDLIEGLVRVKDSFNSYPLSRLAQTGAAAAIADDKWLTQTTRQVMATRERFVQNLAGLGFDILPSCANFVLVHHPAHQAGDLLAGLRERHIIVRQLSAPRIRDWLRITIGTDAEMSRLIGALASMGLTTR